ncbi:uncharacterized protein LOC127705502 [Mytilus californianus]|uniref:uncharacterized protein LOC127705502 n=1 Tax=Mytilus californianus TaxID=6549 RepID=UPI002246A22C|nr:uncharacterized protein LOC127705502 [Mytilus californianus]
MGISERTGIHISRYDFSEAQCGKSYCDAKIAHMRGRIRQYVANGNNVRNATEMKAAIDSFGDKFILNKISTFDEIKLKWKECCDDVTEKVMMDRNNVVLENTKTIDLPMGWALSKDKKIIRFSDKVKTFLRGIFQGGSQGGKKVNAVDVANHMRVCLDEEGNKMFQPHEYLQQGQIASFFSRLAVMAKIPPKRRQTVDDADLESVVAHLNSIEAIEISNNDV